MKKSTKIILFCVALAAFAVRVQVCRELASADPQVSNPGNYTDMWTYRSLSERIVKGEFKKEYYYQPFYYAVFLPALKLAFGFGIWPVILAQCLLSALTVWLAGATASKLWNGTAGIAAAVLAALSTTLILYNAFYLIATLQAFWIALLAFLCVKALDTRDSRAKSLVRRSFEWGGIGFVAGLTILTRGNVWFFVPGILVSTAIAESALISSEKPDAKQRFKALVPAFLFLLMVLATQIPFAWRNTMIKGSLTGPSTAAGAVLCLGDTPESPPGGREAGTGPGPMEYPETCKAWSSEGATSSAVRRILSWAVSQPMAFVELQFRKCLLFWDYREIPNNIAVESDGLLSPTLTRLGLLPTMELKTPFGPRAVIFLNLIPSTAALLILGLAGALFTLIRVAVKIVGKRAFRVSEALLLYFVAAYWLGTAAFYILARFRAPVFPLLAIFAGGFIFHSKKLFFRNRRLGEKAALAAIFAVLFSGAIVFAGYNLYRGHCESTVIRLVRPNGTVSKLDESTFLLLDNGPAAFGGWKPLKTKSGMTLKKRFVIPEAATRKATGSMELRADSQKTLFKTTLKLPLVWNSSGTTEIVVNGKSFHISAPSRPRRETREFEIPLPKDGIVEISFRGIDGELYLFLDGQRDYSRTALNGDKIDSELVASLVIKETRADN
ncbi:MAG: glycosyltransferase family 39 protein [Kiritimatiellaeota bacterium]|nr:glycosyltransferase family 39 protein [Kiritimatiellota bacterium]